MADGTDKDDGDYLGYGVYADTLWNRIQAALDKDLGSDQPPGDDPLVVGIFGEWGAGKSKLLKLTLDRASDYEAQRARNRSGTEGGFGDAGFGLTVPVLFQPWKYEHEPHLLVPLLLHLLQALRDSIPKAQTPSEKTVQVSDSVWSVSIGALPALVENFEAVYKATVADLAVADPVTAAGVSIGFKTAGWLAKLLKRPDDADWLRDFKFSSEGRFYYNFHNVLCALTRPGKRVEAIGKLKLSQNARINFVIFIDDLDRCLPEKAVETLELIKTVFNLESFAFVLALDEEVVERGIGHRYKDYALVNKKPEMPISGFEYLEKIVHLQFRLPPLTARQAMLFVRRHEALIQPDRQRRWFDAPTLAPRDKPQDAEQAFHLRGADLDLLPLVLNCFDHFVPRKLIRLVELMKQLSDVTETPKRRAIDRRFGGQLDPRVVIALVLLQLFAPELYRFLRRRPEAFSTLLSSFSAKAGRALGHHVSDADLCDWVAPLETQRRAAQTYDDRGLNGLMDRLFSDIATHWKTPRERANAQNIRLPLVRLLLEHRALHRNVFDPVKLFQVLASDMQHTGQNPAAVVLRPYLSLLTEKIERRADAPCAYRHRVHQLDAFFDDMVFDDEPVRANILARHDVPEDAFLSRQTVQGLAALVFDSVQKAAVALEGGIKSQMLAKQHANLLHALLQLDEAIAEDDRAAWTDVLASFKGAYETPPPGKGLDNPGAAAHFWEIQSRWALDQRFDKKALGLPVERWPENRLATDREPIIGFVRVETDDSYGIGSKHDSNNLPGIVTLEKPFYMARYLTTVGQYQRFVEDKGYDIKGWWDEQGWAWRSMLWASETNDPNLRDWSDGRTEDQRIQPMR